MKRYCFASAIVLLVVSAVYADGIPERIQRHLDDHLIGRWKITTQWNGEKQEAKNEFRWSPLRNTVIGEWTPVGDGQASASTQVISWDPQTEEVVFSGFSATSGFYVMRYSELGNDKWTGKGTGYWEGQVWESPVSITWKDNEYRYEDVSDGQPFVETGTRVPPSDEGLFKKLSELMLRDGGALVGKGQVTNADLTGDIKQGDSFTIHVTFRPTETKNAMAATFRLTIDGKPDVESVGQELIGWNPTTKSVDVVNYWSSGMVETISFDRCQGTTFYGTYSSHAPGGEVATADVAFVFDEDGNANFNFISGPHKGKTLSSWRRVAANDTQRSLDGESARPNSERLKDLEFFIGSWEANTADGGRLRWTFKWSADRNLIENEAVSSGADGNATSSSRAMLAWDAANRRITNWWVDGTGDANSFVWTRTGEKSWSVWRVGASGTGVVTIIDNNTWDVDWGTSKLVFKRQADR